VVAKERGLAQPCAEVRRKGDAADVIVWQSATARLLPSHALVWDSVSTRACWLTISRRRASLFSQGREARSGSPASGQVARPGRAGSSPLQHSSPPQAGQHAGSPTVTTSSTRLGGRRRAWRRRPLPACARTAWGLAWVALGEQGCLRLATRRNARPRRAAARRPLEPLTLGPQRGVLVLKPGAGTTRPGQPDPDRPAQRWPPSR
jgi:hypothetical protein